MTDKTPKPATTPAPRQSSRLQRVLAYVIGALVVISIVAILAVIVGTWVGVGNNNGFSKGIWPTIFYIPAIALPLGMVGIIVLLVVSLVLRGRENRGANG